MCTYLYQKVIRQGIKVFWYQNVTPLEAFYYEQSKPTCRLGIELTLTQCQSEPHQPRQPLHSNQKNYWPAFRAGFRLSPLFYFPEATMSVEIENELCRFLVRGERGI